MRELLLGKLLVVKYNYKKASLQMLALLLNASAFRRLFRRLIDVTPQQLIFSEFSTPKTLLFQPPRLLKMAQTSQHHAFSWHHVY